jgi:hypothetical protein
MKLTRVSVALAAPVTALLAVATPAVSASAAAVAARTTAVPCHTWMSNTKPKDYTTVDVWVVTAPHAAVATVAHYRTTQTKHQAWANSKGDAEISYHISGATPGYQVKVAVSVASGHNWGGCSTSFTPHR